MQARLDSSAWPSCPFLFRVWTSSLAARGQNCRVDGLDSTGTARGLKARGITRFDDVQATRRSARRCLQQFVYKGLTFGRSTTSRMLRTKSPFMRFRASTPVAGHGNVGSGRPAGAFDALHTLARGELRGVERFAAWTWCMLPHVKPDATHGAGVALNRQYSGESPGRAPMSRGD